MPGRDRDVVCCFDTMPYFTELGRRAGPVWTSGAWRRDGCPPWSEERAACLRCGMRENVGASTLSLEVWKVSRGVCCCRWIIRRLAAGDCALSYMHASRPCLRADVLRGLDTGLET